MIGVFVKSNPQDSRLIGEVGSSFGWTWAYEIMGSGLNMPSVNQIIEGLANEAKFLIKQAMGNAHSQYKVVQAQNNAAQIWHKMFGVAPVDDPDANLT